MNKKNNAYIPIAEHDPYMSRAAEYCIEMGWNHDATPELAKTLVQHENYVLWNLDWEHINRHEKENETLRSIIRAAYLHALDQAQLPESGPLRLTIEQQHQLGRDLAEFGSLPNA